MQKLEKCTRQGAINLVEKSSQGVKLGAMNSTKLSQTWNTNPDNKNQLISKTYSLEYSKSSILTTETSAQIGEALYYLKIDSSVHYEAQWESRTIPEYHIEF